MQEFNALIMTTAADYRRLRANYHRLVNYIPAKRICFVGSSEVGELVDASDLGDKVRFINENDILPFDAVHTVMKNRMEPLLQGRELPRGVTGWYYQQFLKMQYACICPDTYYMVWDGDTVPCASFAMFQEELQVPYLDLKHEFHVNYFDTIEKLLPGMHKCIEPSFISEHMLISSEIMRNLIEDIEKAELIDGTYFWEKILHAIDVDKIQEGSFSEFETYGTYVCFKYPSAYRLREWHSFRLAGEFFDPNTISDEDYRWLSHDFDAVSFEKGHSVREDHKNLFDNKIYQEKLTARQMLEIAQQEFKEGYLEVWKDETSLTKDTSVKQEEYHVYERMGDELIDSNINQAYLCYENAEFLCSDVYQKSRLTRKRLQLLGTGDVSVQKTAIVILSYNNMYLMQKCLESIRETCAPGACSVVVVDNASTDGVKEWLMEQPDDILVVLNEENAGFPAGCNIGIQYTEPGQDILLLNNDTRMTQNALFWLRMGLYENEHIGATGCVANYCGIDQLEDVTFNLPAEYTEYAKEINIPMKQPYEEKNKLGGFGMLIRGSVLDEVGLLDEAFSPGYFEDDDLSMRIHVAGYRLLVCHNSFIYHAGSQSFIKRSDLEEVFERNHKYMISKWGYDNLTYSVFLEQELEQIMKITHGREDFFRVLEVGAGSGNALSRITYLYPNAEVIGIEENPLVVSMAVETIPILCMDWKKEKLPFIGKCFDYIIYNDRLGLGLPKELIEKYFRHYLKDNGKLFFVF